MAPVPSACRVTQGYFPPPDEALDLGWTPAQMMEGCRRVPQEELTDELRTRLLTAGLPLAQIAELFCFSRAKRNRIRQEAIANSPDDDPEAVLEQLEDDDTMEDDEMAAAIKLASLEEAKQYGIKLPEEGNKTMKFHEAVLSGQMDPRQAIIKCEPSERGDITKEVLDKCAAVGMTAKEIAPGFRVKESLIYNECWRKNVKLLKKNRYSAKPVAPENTKPGNVSGGGHRRAA